MTFGETLKYSLLVPFNPKKYWKDFALKDDEFSNHPKHILTAFILWHIIIALLNFDALDIEYMPLSFHIILVLSIVIYCYGLVIILQRTSASTLSDKLDMRTSSTLVAFSMVPKIIFFLIVILLGYQARHLYYLGQVWMLFVIVQGLMALRNVDLNTAIKAGLIPLAIMEAVAWAFNRMTFTIL